jgi:hypothetical protein
MTPEKKQRNQTRSQLQLATILHKHLLISTIGDQPRIRSRMRVW